MVSIHLNTLFEYLIVFVFFFNANVTYAHVVNLRWVNFILKNECWLNRFKVYVVYPRVRLFWIHTTISFFKIFFIFSMCVKILRGCLDEKKISLITEISLLITHHSITYFLSPNNDEISLKARLAPKAQLCFQPKKLKKLGTTDWALCSATERLPAKPFMPTYSPLLLFPSALDGIDELFRSNELIKHLCPHLCVSDKWRKAIECIK